MQSKLLALTSNPILLCFHNKRTKRDAPTDPTMPSWHSCPCLFFRTSQRNHFEHKYRIPCRAFLGSMTVRRIYHTSISRIGHSVPHRETVGVHHDFEPNCAFVRLTSVPLHLIKSRNYSEHKHRRAWLYIIPFPNNSLNGIISNTNKGYHALPSCDPWPCAEYTTPASLE